MAALALSVGTASGADKKLLSLVMPDVTVLAGINVRGATASPLGQFVFTAMVQRNQQLQQASVDFGLDPQSFREVLVASNSAPKYDAGIALARGSFDPHAVIARAADHGALTEKYKGVTLVSDEKQTLGLAFLGSGILLTGDLKSVKAALGRAGKPWIPPAALAAQVAQLSASEDAWVVSTVPVSKLLPASASSAGAGRGVSPQNLLQSVERLSAGVKFGTLATVTAVAQVDTPETAQLLANTLRLMVNLMQAQARQLAPDSAQSLVVEPRDNLVNISFHVTDAEFRKMYQMMAGAAKPEKKL